MSAHAFVRSSFLRLAGALVLLATASSPARAASSLTIQPITWNVVGLDSNDPLSGPNRFPVGVRVCSAVPTTNVGVQFVWDSANANVNLRPGSLTTVTIPTLGAGQCADAYFEVEVTRTPAAFDTTRRYHVTATDVSGTVSTPTPRELYVEHLVSQGRNENVDMKLDGVSIPPGGSIALVVGGTYTIEVVGGTATQGYEQFESFIDFPNTVFQILSVSTAYSADNSPYVPNPNPGPYADACRWQNDPNAPTYRSCIGGDYKAGGSNVVTTYVVRVIGGGGTSETLNTLLYDFSGSSFHYNSDLSSDARIAAVVDPSSAGISKSFTPAATTVGGISRLTVTLTNPNAAALSGYSFVDPLPSGMTVANPPAASIAGCGAATFSPWPGDTSLTFSGGTVAANGTCTAGVNVTVSSASTFENTTNHLFVGSIDTGNSATAQLVATSAPPPQPCIPNQVLASWTMDPAQGTTVPPAPSYKSLLASTAVASYAGSGTSAIDTTYGAPVNSWGVTSGWAADPTGYPNAGASPYMEFALDTSRFTGVQAALSYRLEGNWAASNNNRIYVYSNAGGGAFSTVTTITNPAKRAWNSVSNVAAAATGSATTAFRINAVGQQQPTAQLLLDNVTFTGCAAAVPPTIAKSFSPATVAVGGTSTLTFTLTNTVSVPLTGASFSDALPAGVQVAATPAASTTCGGTWAPAAGATTVALSGGTIPAAGAGAGSCTAQVNVTATTAGPHENVTGYVSADQSGPNTGAGGSASAPLAALAPPAIAKVFGTPSIVAGGVVTLTFAITNPNVGDALGGVGFVDHLPPGMLVASAPNASTSGCGSPTFAPVSGATSFSFSGGTIAAGGTCVATVDVTASLVASYTNASDPVSFVLGGNTITGNQAVDSIAATAPHPSISLAKQVSASASGPWSAFARVAAGGSVYYRFVVENTGDVPLTSVGVVDPAVNTAGCTWPATLPVASPTDDPTATCVVGPLTAATGSQPNTATAHGGYGADAFESAPATATYATPGLTTAKSVAETAFLAPGDVLHYSYLVTNTGFAPLLGPVLVTDDKAGVTCPAVSTVGDLDDWLDPGESLTCTAAYTVTVADVALGTVTNAAWADAEAVASNTDHATVTKLIPVTIYHFDAE